MVQKLQEKACDYILHSGESSLKEEEISNDPKFQFS